MVYTTKEELRNKDYNKIKNLKKKAVENKVKDIGNNARLSDFGVDVEYFNKLREKSVEQVKKKPI